jgi:hypothetical protein
MSAVLVVGDPFDGGLECYGPFPSELEAGEWGAAEFPDNTYWSVKLHDPEAPE